MLVLLAGCPRGGDRLLVLVLGAADAGAGAGAVGWLCAWWRQFAGADAGCRDTGCWCWCWVMGAGCARGGAGAGAGAVSWLCTWWRPVADAGAGAGCRMPVLVLVL